jgi:hypothetical protein
MHRIAQIAFVLLLAAVLGRPAGAGAQVAGSASRVCGTVSGPVAGPNRTGRYQVLAVGVDCPFAKASVTRILRKSLPAAGFVSFAGPAGWQCVSAAVTRHVALSGSCQASANHRRSFVWGAGK